MKGNFKMLQKLQTEDKEKYEDKEGASQDRRRSLCLTVQPTWKKKGIIIVGNKKITKKAFHQVLYEKDTFRRNIEVSDN